MSRDACRFFQIFLAGVLGLVSVLPAYAGGDHGAGNGGDTDAAEYQRVVTNVAALLATYGDDGLMPFSVDDVARIREAAASVRVIMSPGPVNAPDGKPRDAVTTPEDCVRQDKGFKCVYRTEVDLGRWRKKNAVAKRRIILVAHELLIASGLEESDQYGYTTQFLARVRADGWTFEAVAGSRFPSESKLTLAGKWRCRIKSPGGYLHFEVVKGEWLGTPYERSPRTIKFEVLRFPSVPALVYSHLKLGRASAAVGSTQVAKYSTSTYGDLNPKPWYAARVRYPETPAEVTRVSLDRVRIALPPFRVRYNWNLLDPHTNVEFIEGKLKVFSCERTEEAVTP